MRKITSLLMLLCMFVGMAWAAPTDLPEMSTEGNIKYYTISNTRSTSGKYLYWTESGVKDANALKLSSLFYFTGTAEECYIHNAATDLLFTGAGAWNSTGVKCEICVTPHGDGTTGLAIKFSGTALNEANTSNGYTTWGAGDAGSVFVMDVANVAQMAADYKTAANSALDMISFLGVDEAKATIANLEANINTFAAVDAAVNGVAQHIAIRNGDTDPNQVRYNAYLAAHMPDSKGHGTKPFDWKNATWSLKYSGDGSFYIYNVNNEVYLGDPNSRGALTVTPIAAYTFAKYGETANNLFELKCGNQVLHLQNTNGDGTVSAGWALMSYSPDVASSWYIETDFAAHVATYKTTALTTLDSWKTLSVVFDGALVGAAKTAINDITTTNYATFAAIDAELKKVTDAVAAKMFTFQTLATDNKRNGVWVSANASTGKAIGAETQDYNAIWSLRHAGGTSFYIYNELTAKYMGKPSGNAALTDTPVDAYTFEIIDAANGVVEFKCGGETLHASNHDDDKLMNHDGDEAASRWYIRTIDITADIQAILDGLTSEDYAETPALGQYPKAAYDALVTARTTAKTVEEVDAAIAAFKASLNAPVYIISGVHDYANGKAIYYNGSNPEWRWDTKNAYNKAMWFRVLGLTTPEFELNTEYNVVDMSGRNIYNKASIKFETVENWPGVYCLKYGTGDSDYLHLANHSNNLVTNWYRATIKADGTPDSGASAFNVVYIGNSYDLAQLSDELFTAAAELAAVNVPNFSFATSVNNYNPDTKPALDAAIANRAEVLGKLSTAEEIAAAKSQLETAIDGVAINMPVNGKFYRVRCAGNGMKYLQSDLDDSNAEDIRLKVLSDAKSVAATFCYVDGALVSYTTGKSINAYRYDAVGTKSAVVFSEASNGKLGTYNITIGGRYIFGASDNNKIDSGLGTPDNRDGYTWWLEEVNEIPVTISEACYATFYSPVAVTLPEGLTAYTVSAQSETSATLEEVEDVIPANTGVLLYADVSEPTTYHLTIGGEGSEVLSLMEGTVASAYIQGPAFILGYVNVAPEGEPEQKEVAFYNVILDQDGNTSFINNGFKAYLPADGNNARFITFDFGTETAIKSVESVENNAVVYDLAGRRVQKVQKGLYIVNGVKVIK